LAIPGFEASDGARFEARIQNTPAGPLANFGIYVDIGDATRSTTNTRQFKTQDEAIEWLDQNALAHGFDKYPLE
jgi:hypothetical protein